jgi:phosphoglycolate phosphatase-like HAD superfamily hydrolase
MDKRAGTIRSVGRRSKAVANKAAAVFFDLDGTLVDSKADIKSCLGEAFKKAGISLADFDLRFKIGPPLSGMLDEIAPGLSVEQKKTVSKLFRQLYDTSGFPSTCAYEGIEALLEKLKVKKVPIFIVTNKPHLATHRIIEKLNWHFFRDVLTPDFKPEVTHSKSALLKLVCQKEGFLPGHCLMVGDLPEDMRAAHTAGVSPVGVTWGYGNNQGLLEAASGVSLIATPGELLKMIQEPV